MDERSDEEVYESHAPEMVRFATGLVGPDDAPDVVVEAFVRVANSRVWTRARDRRVLWIRAIEFEARSFVRASARRRAREHRVFATSVSAQVAVGPDADVAHCGSDDADAVGRALERLSIQQRAVVVLTYWFDLTPATAAEVLGVSEGTVRKQLARARQRIREELT